MSTRTDAAHRSAVHGAAAGEGLFPRSIAVTGFLGVILAVAAGLDLYRLGVRSLWQDEATSVTFAHLAWPTFAKVLWRGEANMALYYGLLHLWVAAFGDGESAVRMLSTIMAVGAVAALYTLGARMFGARVGAVGALLLAVNAYQITYAQEARGYSLLLLLATLSSLAFLRMLEEPSPGRAVRYAAYSLLAVYTHLFGTLVLMTQWLSLLFLKRRPAVWKAFAPSAAAVCALTVPLLLVAARTSGAKLDWIPKLNPRAVLNFFYVLVGSGETNAKPLLLAYFVACAAGVLWGIRQFRTARASISAWRYCFLVLWFFGPLALTLGVSLIKPIFVSYYLIVILPPLTLLAAVGISKMPAMVGIVVLAAALATAVYEDAHYFASPAMEDWRGATAYTAAHLRPGDGFVFYPAYLEKPFDYYQGREFRAGEPRAAAFPWRWDSVRGASGDPKETRAPDAVLRRASARYSRIWMFYRRGPVDAQLLRILRAAYTPRGEHDFGAVTVALYTRSNEAALPAKESP